MELESEPIREAPPDNRSLEEKLVDKNWKTRVAAYEELGQQLKAVLGDDPIFDQYSPLLAKIVSDINASALDAGLAVVTQFIDQYPEGSVASFCKQHGDKVATCVIDKALSGRTTVQEKGKTLLLKLMEVDDPSACTAILLGKLSDKKPKIPPMCLGIIKEGIGLFGAKTFPIRDIIAKMGDAMNKGTSDTRAAAMALMMDITKWIGTAPFAAMLDTIKPVQKAEFESLYAARDVEEDKPKPLLYLRKDRAAAILKEESAQSSSTSGGGGGNLKQAAAVNDDDDAREYVQEVDLVKVLKASDYSKLIAEEKWSEQLKGLQLVIDAIGPTPKIKPGSDVYDIVGVCKGFLRAGHLSLQQASLKILTLLADGLRSDFTNTLRPVLQAVISKSKEKRLLNDVKMVLQKAIQHCVSYDVVSDDISELVKSKKTPPHARLCLMESITDTLLGCPEKANSDSLKAIADTLMSSCQDSDPKVREMCVKTFAVLAEVVKARGRSAIEAHKVIMKLEQSVPKVYKRIQTMKEGGESGASSSTTTTRPGIAKVASASAVTTKKSVPNALVKSKSVSAGKSSSTAGFSNKLKGGETAPATLNAIVEDDNAVEEVNMSPEDATEKLAEMNIAGWSNILTLITSAKWQERVDALGNLEKHIDNNEAGGVICVPMTSFLKSHFPKLKSTNMTITKAIMQLYTTCANHTGSVSFSKSVALEIILAWGEKFSDKKGKDAFGDLLTVLAGVVSPGFCVKQMKKVMDKTKAPLGHQYYLEWLKTAVNEFGAAALPVSFVVTCCHGELENKAVGVRNAAVEVLAALFHQLGPKFLSLALTDAIKPAMKSILEAEFDKIGYDASKQPSRTVKGQASIQKDAGFSIPRTDLATALDRSTISNITMTEGKNSWQIRKTAMEAVIEACDRSSHFIEGNAASKEVLKSLKARLNDTQANLKPMGALALGHVLSSLDAESCHKFLKPLATSLLSGIADNKKSMRDAVVNALQMIVTLSQDKALADPNLIGTLLASSVEAIVNPVGREELLSFFLLHVDSDVVIKTDCSEIAPSLVVALQDKVAATRVLTEQLMTSLVGKGYLTPVVVEKSFRTLPPAALRSLQAPKDRILAAGDKSGSSSTDDSKKIHSTEEDVKENTTASTRKTTSRVPSKTMGRSAPSSKSITTNAPAPAVGTTPSSSSSVTNAYFPLKKTNKLKRLEDYYKSNWPQPPEEPSENERNALRATWEPLLEKPLFDILFPEKVTGLVNQDSVMGAVAELLSLLNNEPTGATSGCTLGPKCGEMVLQHVDLMLKWVALAFAMRESSNGLLQLLLLVASIFNKIKVTPNLMLHEGEVVCILPVLIDKSGHKSERHKFAFKATINACSAIVSPNRMCQLLLGGLSCKNKKTRVVCIEEIDTIVSISGPQALGKVGIREISSTLNNKNTDVGVRNAALDFCFTLYMQIGYDRNNLTKMLGDISERAVPMIDHRIKEKMKSQEGGQGHLTQKSATSSGQDKDSNAPLDVSKPAAKQQEQHPPRQTEAAMISAKVTTPVMKTNTFVLEDDDLAFRLEMTPPEAESDETGAGRYTNTADALTLNMEIDHLPPPPSCSSPSTEDNLAEIDGVFVEIISKVDVLLSGETSCEVAIVQESINITKEHLKMLNGMITTHLPEQGSPSYEPYYEILQRHAPTLVDKLNHCIDFGFQCKLTDNTDSKDLSALVDLGLISVSLGCMFNLLNCKGLLRYLNESKVTDMLSTGIQWMVDTRFFPSDGSSLAPKEERDLYLALNAYLITIGSSRPFKNGVVICSIIEVMSLCIAEKHASKKTLSLTCAKPLSRLLLKVLSNEASRGSTKAFHLPNVDTMRLMSVLHSFFNSNASTTSKSDIPYCSAKTVLNSLITALGSSEIERLCQVLKIPKTAFVYGLSKRLANAEADSDNIDSSSRKSQQASAPLIPELVSMIDSIASSRDKAAAIRQLRDVLKRDHSGVDISQYLQHTSSYFRNFVLDTLVKLDSEGICANAGVNVGTPTVQHTDRQEEDGNGSEALRILEGLKSTSKSSSKTPKRNLLSSPLSENFARSGGPPSGWKDSVHGTLNSLSSISEPKGVAGGVGASYSVSVTSSGVDSDLAARLQRLKGMGAGS